MTNDEKVDGAKIAAQILDRMNPEHRDRLMKAIAAREPEIATKIAIRADDFGSIAALSGKSVQTLLQHVAHDDLVLSLQTAPEPVKAKLFANMTRNKGELIRDETLATPPRPTASKDAQSRILRKLEELRDRGMIIEESKNDVWV